MAQIPAEQLRDGVRHVLKAARPGGTVVEVGPYAVGGRDFVVIAGPCAVESVEQAHETAEAVVNAGGHLLRGGVFKPRSSPYAFQGMGEPGLALLAEVGRRRGMPVVSEVMDPSQLPAMLDHVDVLQVGARNMQNFYLLKALARVKRPVLLKRGLSATFQEWLQAAEYLLDGGNPNVILCERGIRTFETATRNTLDLGIVALAKQRTHLPVLVDPSHATGDRELVLPLCLAAAAAGADGLLVEVHPRPEEALSDGPQALRPVMFEALMARLPGVLAAVDRRLHPQARRPPSLSARAS